MEILGVGIPEIIFVIIISLLVLGPKDMQKAGATIGKWMRSIITSDSWKIFQQTSREIRTLPNKLIREANDELRKVGQEINPASSMTDRGRGSINPVTRSKPYSPNTIQAPQSDTETEPKQNESDSSTNA
jgi:Sec-independent protein translocase protein TatA